MTLYDHTSPSVALDARRPDDAPVVGAPPPLKGLRGERWLCGTGHRPHKLGRPSDPLRLAIRDEAIRRVTYWRPAKIISGMALGFDVDLAEIAVDLKIPFIAAVPFNGVESRWPNIYDRQNFYRLLSLAERVVYVCPPPYAPWKMQRRNEWMIERVGCDGIVLACWDGSPGGTANAYAYAERRGRTIDRIDPADLRAKLSSC